jgi:cobalt-zinc-cadmium resistance protein CzcA
MRFNELIAGVRSDVAVKVFGEEHESLLPVAEDIYSVLRNISGAADLKIEQVKGLPMLDISVRREQAARLGLTVKDIEQVVATAIGGHDAGSIFEGDRKFDMLVRLPESARKDFEMLGRLPVPLPIRQSETEQEMKQRAIGLRFVPLMEVAELRLLEMPNQVSRENGKRRIVVQANVEGRDLAGFVAEAKSAVEAKVKLLPGQWITWGGQFENLESAKTRLMFMVPLCFVLILVLLLLSLGSVRQALMVFTAVPLALSGGVFSLWLCGLPFSISAAVGFIAVSGVAVLNGLVLVSFFNSLAEAGLSPDEVIVRGSLTRLRPVLMTGLVAAFGFLPMALASGAGAEVQRPLAIVVIGGIVTATALTLFVLPALYRLLMPGESARNAGGGNTPPV